MESPTKSALLIFALALGAYLLTLGGHLYSPDEEIMFRTVEALAERRSLAVESGDLQGFGTRRGSDGRQYSQYGLGQPLAALPFYYLGKTLSKMLTPNAGFWRGAQITFAEAYHGERAGGRGSYWTRFGVSLFNQCVAAVLAAALFLFCFELTRNRRAALLTAALYAFGTMVWVHSKPFFSETLATLCVMLAFYFLARGRRPGGRACWFWAGFFAGYAVFTRADSILALPGLGLFFLLVNVRGADPEGAYDDILSAGEPKRAGRLPLHGDFWRRASIAALPLVGFAAVMLAINYACYGHPLSSGYSDQPEGIQFSTPLHVGLYGFLFSVGKGLFFFSPPLILFFFAIGRFWKEQWPAAVSLLVSAGCFLLVQAKWQNWGGGWCWGPRHIFMLNALLIVPVVALAAQWERWSVRLGYGVLLIAGVAVQLYGCSQSFIDFYFYGYRKLRLQPTVQPRYSLAEDHAMIASQGFQLLQPLPENSPLKRDLLYAKPAMMILLKSLPESSPLRRNLLRTQHARLALEVSYNAIPEADKQQIGEWLKRVKDKLRLNESEQYFFLVYLSHCKIVVVEELNGGKKDMVDFPFALQPAEFAAHYQLAALPPPLSQSFYILEQSTWSGYAALWRERGKHDFFWLWAAGVLPRE